MKNNVNIALIIPFYNEKLFIEQTLRSLARQRVSRSLRWTTVFVDNGSTDNTVDIIRSYCRKHHLSFHLIDEQRKGTVYSRTAGLRYGASLKPEVLISTDADTTFPPLFIETTYQDIMTGDIDFLCGRRNTHPTIDLWKRLTSKNIYNAYRSIWNLEYELFGPYAFGAYFAIKTSTFIGLPLYQPAQHVKFIGEDVLLSRRCFYIGASIKRSHSAVTPNPRKDIALGIRGLRRMPGNMPQTHNAKLSTSLLQYNPIPKKMEAGLLKQIYAFTAKRLVWSAADAYVFWKKTGMIHTNAYTSAQKTIHFLGLDMHTVDAYKKKSLSTHELYTKLISSHVQQINDAIQKYVKTTTQ